MSAQKQEQVKEKIKKQRIIKLKLAPEELKKRRLENLKKANEARKAKKNFKQQKPAAPATSEEKKEVAE